MSEAFIPFVSFYSIAESLLMRNCVENASVQKGCKCRSCRLPDACLTIRRREKSTRLSKTLERPWPFSERKKRHGRSRSERNMGWLRGDWLAKLQRWAKTKPPTATRQLPTLLHHRRPHSPPNVRRIKRRRIGGCKVIGEHGRLEIKTPTRCVQGSSPPQIRTCRSNV